MKIPEMFSAIDDAYMQARSTGVKDISSRIIANLTGKAVFENNMEVKEAHME